MRNWLAIILLLTLKTGFTQNIQITEFRATDDFRDTVYRLDNQAIILDYRKTHILISYKSYPDSLQAIYAYRLLGFEKNWVSAKNQTFANYSNLFGGEYTFEVKNLRFPNKIASVKFQIEEAFWQQAWFIPAIIGYLLLVAGIIFYFFQQNKFKQQQKLQQIRNDISADLHDDVGSTLSNISFLTEIAKSRIKEKPQDVPMILDKILHDSKEMVQTMRGMIWTINPTNDRGVDFFLKVENLVKEVLTPHQIRLSFDCQLPDNQKLNLESQRNLFLVFKEASNNILKYANAENVKITVRKEKEWLMIQIKDDGVGFDLGEETEGNGLRNMKNRMTQLGGSFELKSDEGTRLRMALPLT